MSAHIVYESAPLGSDPLLGRAAKPPSRFTKKLATWKRRNGVGRLSGRNRREPARPIPRRPPSPCMRAISGRAASSSSRSDARAGQRQPAFGLATLRCSADPTNDLGGLKNTGNARVPLLQRTSIARVLPIGRATAVLTAGLMRRQNRRQPGCLSSKRPLIAESKLAVNRRRRRSKMPLWRTSARKPGSG